MNDPFGQPPYGGGGQPQPNSQTQGGQQLPTQYGQVPSSPYQASYPPNPMPQPLLAPQTTTNSSSFSQPSGQVPLQDNSQQAYYNETPHAPNYAPPPPLPPKPSKKGFFSRKVSLPVWLFILLVIVLLVFGDLIGQSNASNTAQNNSNSTANTTQSGNTSQPTAAPTQAPTEVPTQAPTPTPIPKWTTIQTFSGNGIKQTGTFTVGDDWKIFWSCDPSSFYGNQYNVQVYVYSSDGTLGDIPVNTICKAGNISDSTEDHQGGSIYLEINSEGSWKIQVQELK
jgi:hypothetical protein